METPEKCAKQKIENRKQKQTARFLQILFRNNDLEQLNSFFCFFTVNYLTLDLTLDLPHVANIHFRYTLEIRTLL